MKTVVLQSFRTADVPVWMERCMASVRAWAALQGYDYEFMDDRIFDLCGADYLAQVGDNKRSITNLARLELIRLRLAGEYERAIWLDADTFIFAPAAFRMDINSGYAFSREVWVTRDKAGRILVEDRVHNASCVFTRGQSDLDFFIRTARYIAATRQIRESFQVGVKLLSGLQYPLGFRLLQDCAMASPDILQALATGDDGLIALLARGHAHPIHAANIGFSLINPASAYWTGMTEELAMLAMDRLEQSAGAVINRFLSARGAAAPAEPVTTATIAPRRREEILCRLDSPAWLLARALRLLVVHFLPARLTNALRNARRQYWQDTVVPAPEDGSAMLGRLVSPPVG
jgi:hypothetical protein